MNRVLYDALIVGGGHNGLVCAAYLARAGLDVLVLERRHILGGACATEEIFPGYHVSTCSYIVHNLQDRIVDDLSLLEHGYSVRAPDPSRFLPFPSGRFILHWQDVERTCKGLERYSQRDADGYRKWIEFWERAGGIFNRYTLTTPPTLQELRERLWGTSEGALLERLLAGTMSDLLDEFFESDEVKTSLIPPLDLQSIDQPGALLGFASVKTSAFVNPRNQGLVMGGMGALTMAIAQAARQHGVKIRVGAEVKRILVEDNRACGVELIDGQMIRSKCVLSNADPKRTLQLLAKEDVAPATAERVAGLDSNYGTLKFHAAVSELPDFSQYLGHASDPRFLTAIRICPSLAYHRRSVADVLANRPADGPVIDIQIPTIYDKTIAPPGKHIVSMWVRNEPVKPQNATWNELREQEGEHLIDLLTEYAPNFRRSIIDWLLYTPADIEQRVYLTDGNMHHINFTPTQLLGDRLFPGGGHRTPLPGLYMCGVGTHPGGEVSGAPGHNAAHALLADLRNASQL